MKPEIPIYFTGLNGLRAIAAIAVLISHITLGLEAFDLDPFIFGGYEGKPKGLELASYGVTLFFVLSGFLITYLLLKEKEKTATINIRSFYMRRILRIWPLYYTYLILSLIVIYFSPLKYDFEGLGYYIFFMANIPYILGKAMPLAGHYWSMGVEEQYYLFWPHLVKRNQKLLLVSLLIICMLVFLKLFFHFIYVKPFIESCIHLSRIHCMLIGAVGAILYFQNHALFLKVVSNIFVRLIAWGVLILVVIHQFHVASVVDSEIFAVISLVLIMEQIGHGKKLISLENKLFNFLGKISYGIYVVHPLVIFGVTILFDSLDLHLGYVGTYLVICLVTILLAYVSYWCIEKPFLKLKNKFAIIASSSDHQQDA